MKRKEAKKWLIGLSDPVDPDLFLEMLSVFAQASGAIAHNTGPISVSNIVRVGEGAKKLADTPVTRGMRAVNQAIADKGVQGKQGYIARIGTIGQIIAREDLFGDFMDPPDPQTGHRMVAESLIRAAATAHYKLGMKQIGYDLDDVLEKAKNFEAIAAEFEEVESES